MDERLVPLPHPPWLQRAMESRDRGELDQLAMRAPRRARWWPRLCAWWGDAPTVHDGMMVAQALRRCELETPPRWWRWKSWLEWGMPSTRPAVGAVALLHRAEPAVGLLVAIDDRERAVVLTVPRGQPLQLVPLEMRYVVAWRWPAERGHLLARHTWRADFVTKVRMVVDTVQSWGYGRRRIAAMSSPDKRTRVIVEMLIVMDPDEKLRYEPGDVFMLELPHAKDGEGEEADA